MKPDIPSVLVSGEIVINRHLYVGDPTLGERANAGARMVEEFGGAALTGRLIEAVLEADFNEQLDSWKRESARQKSSKRGSERRQDPPTKSEATSGPKPEKPVTRLGCALPKIASSHWPESLIGYTLWSPQQIFGRKDYFWHLFNNFDYAGQDSSSQAENSRPVAGPPYKTANGSFPTPKVLMLDDDGDSFRRQESESLWHLPSKPNRAILPDWIVLKLTGAVGQGDLWRRLMSCDPRKRLVIVVSADFLRSGGASLSRGLSWERATEDLLLELGNNSSIRPLSEARHLIVTFDCDGACWIDFSNREQPIAHLVFDPNHAEGEWTKRRQRDQPGFQNCMTAAVVRTLVSMTSKTEPDFQAPLERGLSAIRNLCAEGHGVALTTAGEFQHGQGFPTRRVAQEMLHPAYRFARTVVPLTITKHFMASKGTTPWSILESWQNPVVPGRPLYGFARQLALRGESTLAHVPYLRIGRLLTAGREEMEELRSLRQIMESYRDSGAGKAPLSIGVFGSPGSGKSFGVKQLAIGIFGGEGKGSYEGWMEFNLSQFASPRDLIGAFHQVRDRVLQGSTPVVFWDEFDSNEYYWLRYLLAPMQDGRFQEEQITHTIGKCVFIFAGGTAETFEEFGATEGSDEQLRQFKLAKGPDFKSRLDGYLNVLGPNQRRLRLPRRKMRPRDDTDIFFPIRRALLIRSILDLKPGHLLQIDSGLLTGLLEVSDYTHGARSLQKILEPLKTTADKSRRSKLRRWRVPSRKQLALHVNSEQFHQLCTRDYLFKTDDNIRKLAPAIHDVWRALLKREKREVIYDLPYGQLPANIKRSNEAAAQRIPDIIALGGLQIVAGAALKREETEVRRQLEHHLEALAEEEHEGWMSHLQSEGWEFAEIRNDEQRRHNCLRPFHQLREADKEKDRNSVRHFPDFVRAAGFKIVFI